MGKISRQIVGRASQPVFVPVPAVCTLFNFIRRLTAVHMLLIAICFLLLVPVTVCAKQRVPDADSKILRIVQNREDLLKLREEAKKKLPRVLHLPPDKTIGTILLLTPWEMLLGGGKRLANASGDVNIPAGAFVELKMFYSASSELKKLKGLKADDFDIVDFSGTDIDDKSLGAIESLSGIKCLRISDTDITNAALAHIAKLSNLEQLFMNRTNITDLNQLRSLKHLQKLAVKSNKIDDSGAQCLCSFKQLRKLQVSQTLITDQTLKCIASLPQLIRIDANQLKQPTDKGIASLAAAKSLTSISVMETKIARHTFLELARLPELRYINVQNTQIAEADALEFKKINKNCDVVRGAFVSKANEAVHF